MGVVARTEMALSNCEWAQKGSGFTLGVLFLRCSLAGASQKCEMCPFLRAQWSGPCVLQLAVHDVPCGTWQLPLTASFHTRTTAALCCSHATLLKRCPTTSNSCISSGGWEAPRAAGPAARRCHYCSYEPLVGLWTPAGLSLPVSLPVNLSTEKNAAVALVARSCSSSNSSNAAAGAAALPPRPMPSAFISGT